MPPPPPVPEIGGSGSATIGEPPPNVFGAKKTAAEIGESTPASNMFATVENKSNIFSKPSTSAGAKPDLFKSIKPAKNPFQGEETPNIFKPSSGDGKGLFQKTSENPFSSDPFSGPPTFSKAPMSKGTFKITETKQEDESPDMVKETPKNLFTNKTPENLFKPSVTNTFPISAPSQGTVLNFARFPLP